MTERKRRDGAVGHERPSQSDSTTKKHKTEVPISNAPIKGRKDKFAERIKALQQLVSPFGKTDTASVLKEALGYIKFLHDQVQVLCAPYLESMPLPNIQVASPRESCKH